VVGVKDTRPIFWSFYNLKQEALMQIQSLRIASYRGWKIDGRPHSDIVKKKFKLLRDFDSLKAN